MSARKPYNDRAGYRASRRSGAARGWVVIYEAAAQGIDVDGYRYAVVCETHATICGASSMPRAREIMAAVDFCEPCIAARTDPGAWDYCTQCGQNHAPQVDCDGTDLLAFAAAVDPGGCC